MTHVRKGQLTASGEWRKHLRDWKRIFWKAERKEAQRQARRDATETTKARPPRRAFDLGLLLFCDDRAWLSHDESTS